MHPQLTAKKVFQEFDTEGKGHISPEDIMEFLKQFYIRVKINEAE